MKSERWTHHYMRLAMTWAQQSKDPSTKVGAVIVGPDGEEVSSGYNGFPRGILDSVERLSNREKKLGLTVHAESNAILNAARMGVATKGCSLFTAGFNALGRVVSTCPCSKCALNIIQAGIKLVVSGPIELCPPQWLVDFEYGRALLLEGGIEVAEIKI
jgi:dCMP deaminase